MLPARYRPLTTSVIPGGFGTVQPVLDTFLDRRVLFKSMHDPKHNAQLVNELKALSRARSRHVVEIYDVIFDRVDDVVGIVIEKLEGREFADFHKEATANTDAYVRVLYQIGTAISNLHRAGIVHRDLKLDNLRATSAGIVKLFDFGIAVDSVDYRTMSNRGSLVYAAPELFVRGAQITPAMDVYALGVCAWALAVAKFPAQLLETPPQTTSAAPSISTAIAGLPDQIVALIDACLSADPLDRPTASAVSELLGLHLVRGAHKGLFVQGSNAIYELSDSKPYVRITLGALGELMVRYEGVSFRVVGVTGSVFINNYAATPGTELPEACVLTFGDSTLGSKRQWVTFSSSHPEVIL
jgi:eukaryotic-like serine/threonine-protein kinase